MSKRVLSLVLALVMVLGTFGTVFAEDPVNEKIEWLKEQGLVVGDAGTGNLRLADPIKRSEVAVMVTKALDLEAVAKASAAFPSVFKDMNPLHWANGFVNVAAGRGFISGYPDGTFKADNNVNYAEMASMLVRVLGGLTEAEQKAAVWPTTWLAKAAELGLFDGVVVADYNAPATRQHVFEMVYNAVVNTQAGNYSIVKAIVLENYRVEKLDKDEVVVEILQEVQRSKFVDESRDVKGDQLSLVIPAKVGDVEDLLGKVANFTLDKDNKVVAVKVDESYKVEIDSFKATKNKFGKYTVELPERYREKSSDERIFRTYFNNEAFAYEDFYKQDKKDEFKVEYAKVTVKNGKVLFIDAFNFEDIAPVKEVKKDGAEVFVYNDARDGSVKRYDLKSSTKVLLVEDGKVGLGTMEDIEANDVIHEFKGGFIVRKDAKVDGKFVKVSENRDGEVFVHIDEEEYLVGEDDNKKPVYAFEDGDFYTLEAKSAASSLKEFRGENATALLDVAGNLQYVGSEVELGEFVALVTKVVGKDIRVLKADNKTYDYYATLSTKVNGPTGHKTLNSINVGDLVYMTVDGEAITKLELFDKKVEDVDALTTRDIKLETSGNFRILDDTVIFVKVGSSYEVRTAKAVADAYKDKPVAKAFVLNGEEFGELSRRPASKRAGEAHTIVITSITLKSDLKTQIVEFDGFADRQETEMRIRFEDRTRETRELDIDNLDDLNLKGGDIIEIKETKDDDKVIKEVNPLIRNDQKNVFKVVSYDRSRNLVVEAKDGTDNETAPYYVNNSTVIFGNLGSAKRVSIALDGDTRYVKAILVEKDNAEVNGVWPKVKPVDPDLTLTELYDAVESALGKLTFTGANSITTQAQLDEAKAQVSALDKAFKVAKAGGWTEAELKAIVGYTTKLDAQNTEIDRAEEEDLKSADQVAGEAVEAQLALIPGATATLADKEAVVAARAAYEALSAKAKEYVSEARLNKLIAAEEAIAALEKPANDAVAAVNAATTELQMANALKTHAVEIGITDTDVTLAIAKLMLGEKPFENVAAIKAAFEVALDFVTP